MIEKEKVDREAEAEKIRLETLPEKKWILISENKGEITRLEYSVKAAMTTLNELEKLAGVKSIEQYNEIAADVKGWIESQMMADSEIKKLAVMIPIENLIIPQHLQQVRQLFAKPVSFDCLKYCEGWQIDQEALHVASNQFRSFAKTARTVARYQLAKQFADSLNSLQIGLWSRRLFTNEIADWRQDAGKFMPVETFVLAKDDQYQN
jgi:hypothetical protein